MAIAAPNSQCHHTTFVYIRERNIFKEHQLMADIRVGIAGLGAIGRTLAKSLSDGVPGLALACAGAGDRAKAQAWLDAQAISCPLVRSRISQARRHCDRMRAGLGAGADLPSDARSRKAGDGALRRRSPAPP
jgi:hypothetical protein